MIKQNHTFVVAYQDDNSIPHFLKLEDTGQGYVTWTKNPMVSLQFDTYQEAHDAKNRALINSNLKSGMCVLTFDSIARSTPHYIERILDEAVNT